MPAKSPRISVTLKPSTYAVLQRLASLSKQSQSAIVGELVEVTEPILERSCRVLEAAATASAEVKARVRTTMEQAEQVLDRQLGLMLADVDHRTADLVDGLEAVKRRQRASPTAQPAGALPPLSNRGGANPSKGKKTAPKRAQRRAKARRRS